MRAEIFSGVTLIILRLVKNTKIPKKCIFDENVWVFQKFPFFSLKSLLKMFNRDTIEISDKFLGIFGSNFSFFGEILSFFSSI